MQTSSVSILMVALLIFPIFFPNFAFADYNIITDLGGYKQEISIPVDTSLDNSKYQPMDIRITFENSCWAKNETIHSVRVGMDDGSDIQELESQIYDLEHIDDSHISACSLVFIIPSEADGEEKYYVFYDSSEKNGPDYKDHIKIVDTHYFYEPITGQIMDFDYYQVIEDGYIVYGITQKGELLGNGMSNCAVKLKLNSTEFETVNAEQVAPFYISYSIDPPGEYTGSQWATEISKTVLVDGNLMARARIEGKSPEGTVKTDNIYTYYYNPLSSKRLSINVNHKVLKTTEISGTKQRDPTYASLATIKARSATIEKMNIGDILPKIHFYSEDNNIIDYDVPTDPDASPAEWLLITNDDNDLGSKAWICMDDPSTGKAHGFVFSSNTGLTNGENDGIQVKSSVQQHVKLPGLEADTGDVYACRNSYENGNHNTKLEQGTIVSFDLEFITFEKEGYEAVDKESEIFQKIVTQRPVGREDVSVGPVEEQERYSLTAFVHFARSCPLGVLLSAVSGKKFSYIYAELIRDNSIASSGSVVRLPMGEMDLEFDNKTIIETVKMVVNLFDWKNTSLFKKIRFPDLTPGTYVVKIYRENPLLKKEREFIGYSIVNLESNQDTRIFCSSQGSLELSVLDQVKNPIENVRFSLVVDDQIISDGVSNKNGKATLNAPCYPSRPYKLKCLYKGFLVKEKQIKFGIINSLIPIKESFNISLFQLRIEVKDTWDLAPAVDINPTLTSENMVEKKMLSAEKTAEDEYIFSYIYPEDYTLKTSYKSYVDERTVKINKNEDMEISFNAEFNVDFQTFNAYSSLLSDGVVNLKRQGKSKNVEINGDGSANTKVPPGRYLMTLTLDEKTVANYNIDIKSDKSVNVVANVDSLLHNIAIVFGMAIVIFAAIIVFWKKQLKFGLWLIALGFLIIAIANPWWSLAGESGNTSSTSTQTLLVPSAIVTMTSTADLIGGEISEIPEELTMVLQLLSLLIIVTCICLPLTIILHKRFQKLSTIILSVAGILVLIVVLLFFVAMSQVTEVGVGSFIGNGDLEISLPGTGGNVEIMCNWGPGIGFYLGVVALFIILFVPGYKIVNKLKNKFFKKA